jgi:Protein of unknown function (DUF3147)
MLVKLGFSAVRRTRWHEYATRFVFGGAVTAFAGIIANHFGPGVGGLFLAFPAIFPASASLIQKHEPEKKENAGMDGTARGRIAAGVDALGAAMGCVGLAAFAIVVWKLLPRVPTGLTLMTSTLAWAGTSVTVWIIRKRVRRFLMTGTPAENH